MYKTVETRSRANREYRLLVACDMPEARKPNGEIRTFGEWLKYKMIFLEDPKDQAELNKYWATLEEE
jgi:hypothetical protein